MDSHSEVALPVGAVKRLGRGKINGGEGQIRQGGMASKIAKRRSVKRVAGGMMWRVPLLVVAGIRGFIGGQRRICSEGAWGRGWTLRWSAARRRREGGRRARHGPVESKPSSA